MADPSTNSTFSGTKPAHSSHPPGIFSHPLGFLWDLPPHMHSFPSDSSTMFVLDSRSFCCPYFSLNYPHISSSLADSFVSNLHHIPTPSLSASHAPPSNVLHNPIPISHSRTRMQSFNQHFPYLSSTPFSKPMSAHSSHSYSGPSASVPPGSFTPPFSPPPVFSCSPLVFLSSCPLSSTMSSPYVSTTIPSPSMHHVPPDPPFWSTSPPFVPHHFSFPLHYHFHMPDSILHMSPHMFPYAPSHYHFSSHPGSVASSNHFPSESCLDFKLPLLGTIPKLSSSADWGI